MTWFEIIDWANTTQLNNAYFWATFLPLWGLVMVGVTAVIERYWK